MTRKYKGRACLQESKDTKATKKDEDDKVVMESDLCYCYRWYSATLCKATNHVTSLLLHHIIT